MRAARDDSLPDGIADLPLSTRRELEVEKQRELNEGLTRRHLNIAEYRQRYLAEQFARILNVGPELAAKLRGK